MFIKRNIAFSNFNVTCVKKKYLKLVYLKKKKVRLLKKKLRQKQKALKGKKKMPLRRRNLEIQEHAVELSVNFTIKKIYSL